MTHLIRPRAWRRPRLGIGLHRVGATGQQQLDHLEFFPSARPSQRSAAEYIVALVDAGARVEKHTRQNRATLSGIL